MRFLGILIKGLSRVFLIVAVCIFSYIQLLQIGDARITATTIITLAGTLTGFLMTSLSIMVSSADKPFIKALRKTGHFQSLLSDFMLSAGAWVVIILLGLLFHLVPGATEVLAISIALFVYSLMFFLRTMLRFREVLLQLAL